MRTFVFASVLSWIAAAPAIFAAGTFDAEVAPFIGGGTTSGAQVTAVSGASVALGRDFELGSAGLRVAPRLEVTNSLIDTKTVRGDTTTLGSYNNTVLAVGGRVSDRFGAFGWVGQRVYGSLMLGRSFSRLSLDTSSRDASTIADYQDITGTYAAAEVGTLLPLRSGFGLTLAAVSGLYVQNQGRASGSFAENRLNSGGQLALGGGDQSADRALLPGRIVQRTLALKCGLTLVF